MAYYLTTVSHGTTGVKTITCGFAAKHLRITVSKRTATDTASRLSVGDYDLDRDLQIVDSFYSDTTIAKTDRVNGQVVNALNKVSGSVVTQTSAKVNQATYPWTSTEVKYEVLTADSNMQYKVEIWD